MFHKKQVKVLFFSLVLLLVIGFSFFIFNSRQEGAVAAPFVLSNDPPTGHNIYGWAWSNDDTNKICEDGPHEGETCTVATAVADCGVGHLCVNLGLGWISFNSAGIGPIVGGAGQNTWGVTVERSRNDIKNVSGYAWSGNFGWICFGATCASAVPDPGADPDGNDPPIAQYNADSTSPDFRKFSGWANVLTLGERGWIKLSGVTTDGHDYGLQWNSANKEVEGWAWNKWLNSPPALPPGTGIGWISFNCLNGGNCGTSDYKVVADLNYDPVINGSPNIVKDFPAVNTPVLPLPAGVGAVSDGETATFRTDWDDYNDGTFNLGVDNGDDGDNGDDAKAFFCKNGLNLNKTANPNDFNAWTCNGGAGNTWCITNESKSQSLPLTCDKLFNVDSGVDPIGYEDIFVTVCDEWGRCIMPFQYPDKLLINDRPTITANHESPEPGFVLPTQGTVADSFVEPGDNVVNFNIDWSDQYTKGGMEMFVCHDSDTFDIAAGGCLDAASNPNEYCRQHEIVGVNTNGNITCDYDLKNSEFGVINYKVYVCDDYQNCSFATNDSFFVNSRSTVQGGMTAPNFDNIDACSNDANDRDLVAKIGWFFHDANSGDTYDDYRIELFDETDGNFVYSNILANNDASNLGAVNTICNTTSDGAECLLTLLHAAVGNNNVLKWGHSYSFSIQVHDSIAWSEPEEFDVSDDDTLTFDVGWNTANTGASGTGDASDKTFTTYAHNFPVVIPDGTEVRYLPDPPSSNEEVRMTPRSTYYTTGNFGSASTTCMTAPVGEECSFLWFLPVGSSSVYKPNNSTSNLMQPIIIFSDDGVQKYEFTVTDKQGYYCSTAPGSQGATVNKSLPSWVEVY